MKIKWNYKKCQCGHEACRSYRLDFAHSEGMVTEKQARLICAAPEMLFALKVIAQTLEHNCIHIPEEKIEQYAKDAALVDAAIAKAEGRGKAGA